MIAYYLTDKNFLLGLGTGLIVSTLVLYSYGPINLSKATIEKKAREMGMKYPDEIKAYFEKDKK